MDQILRRRSRWSGNDRYFGPFTFSWAGNKDYRPLAVILKSWGDGDDDAAPASLRLSLVWFTLIIWLPPILQPQRQKVYPNLDAATVARLGRNWYWNVEVREYGFSYSDGFVQIHYGISPGDSSRDQTWAKHLPWTQWRQIAHRLYNADGSLAPEKGSWKGGVMGHGIDMLPGETQEQAFRRYCGKSIALSTGTIKSRSLTSALNPFRPQPLSRKTRLKMSRGETKYSDEIAGDKGNFKLPARFDFTSGRYLGITQKAANGEIERVLLAPAQIDELFSFAKKHKG